MTKIARNQLRGDWQSCLIRETKEYVILDSGCWRRINYTRGLGDSIARALDRIGVKQCAGCKARQEALNRAFPYPLQ